MFAVLRSSGAWSEGGTQRRGGRDAKSARRFGGSLSVIANKFGPTGLDDKIKVMQLWELLLIGESTKVMGQKLSRRKRSLKARFVSKLGLLHVTPKNVRGCGDDF